MRNAIGFTMLFVASSIRAQQPATLKVAIVPSAVIDLEPSEVVCTITTAQKITAGSLVVYAPIGFSADPQSVALPALDEKLTIERRIKLKAVDANRPNGPRAVSAELAVTTDTTPARLVASVAGNFKYTNTCISISTYLMWGILGVVIGYVVRYVVNVLKKSTPTATAELFGVSTTIPEKYYYLIDGAVTAVIGFLVLGSLIKNGRPPEQACAWYSSILAGVALGFLTNSDLMTKLPIPKFARARETHS